MVSRFRLAGFEEDPPRGGIPLYCTQRVGFVNKILIGFKKHPVCPPLLLAAHRMLAEAFNLCESSPQQPVAQTRRCGHEPRSWHLGIGFLREQGQRLLAADGLRLQQQAAAQSALEWGRVQEWALQPEVQCKQTQRLRVCVRLFGERVLLIAGNDDLLLWQGGDIAEGQIRFSAHGWSDFCPLKESTLCQLP